MKPYLNKNNIIQSDLSSFTFISYSPSSFSFYLLFFLFEKKTYFDISGSKEDWQPCKKCMGYA